MSLSDDVAERARSADSVLHLAIAWCVRGYRAALESCTHALDRAMGFDLRREEREEILRRTRRR